MPLDMDQGDMATSESDTPDHITPGRIRELCAAYRVPESLRALDKAREESIPRSVHERSPPHVTKDELVTLMDWKLKHGKWRPNLQKMVRTNSEAEVTEATTNAFESYRSKAPLADVLKILKPLKAVGPATATLLLSVFDARTAPFFADELFRYMHLTSEGRGWDRKIKYDAKEAIELYDDVAALMERLNRDVVADQHISALDLEKAAYVLGRASTESGPSPPVTQKRTAAGENGPEDAPRKSKRSRKG